MAEAQIEMTAKEMEDAEIIAANAVSNIKRLLDIITNMEYTPGSEFNIKMIKGLISDYMGEYQTNYAKLLDYVQKECDTVFDYLFDFGEEVDIDEVSDGIDRFSKLVKISDTLLSDVSRLNSIIILFNKQLNRIPGVLEQGKIIAANKKV